MSRFHAWSSNFGLVALSSAFLLAGCDAPTSPMAGDGEDLLGLASYQAGAAVAMKGLSPSDPPECEREWDDERVLCLAAANTKHGNGKGLPVNLKGTQNGNGDGATLMVTVLGTLEFNLAALDLSTVRAGDVNTLPSVTPLSLLGNGGFQASTVDVNGDGILDQVFHFSIGAMVAAGDLSETTMELCVYGEGPGYVLNGCGTEPGQGGGNGNGNGLPSYKDLVTCTFNYRAAKDYRCAIIQLFGKDGNAEVSVLQIKESHTPVNEYNGFPAWNEISADSLIDRQNGGGDTWVASVVPFGWDNSGVDFLFGTCGLEPSAYFWRNNKQLLVRTDLYIPPEAQTVQIEFIVDDKARVFFNGTELTRDWSFGREDKNLCRTYELSTTLTVPQELLSPDGVNKLGVWASDSGGHVNYLDFRVFAEVPQT